MNDIRLCKRGSNFVIQDWSNERKQIAKYSTKTAARAALKKLIADAATKKVVLDDRHKVRELFQKYAAKRLDKLNKELLVWKLLNNINKS